MAWAGSGASLTALYASAASVRSGGSSLVTVERSPLRALHDDVTLQSVSQAIAAAAYAMVAQGQAVQYGKLDLLK